MGSDGFGWFHVLSITHSVSEDQFTLNWQVLAFAIVYSCAGPFCFSVISGKGRAPLGTFHL